MTETKLGKAYRDYTHIMIDMVKWIMGITIVEITFVFIQKYYFNSFLFILFMFFSGVTFIIAVLMMYVSAKQADLELHSALTTMKQEQDEQISKDDFYNSYHKRQGVFGKKITNFIIDGGLYKWLFLSFFLGTINMIILFFTQID